MSYYLGVDQQSHNFPVAGDKMRFLGENGYPAQLERALGEFDIGEVVTVEECYVGGSETSLKFRCHAGWHNSVMFARVSDGNPSGAKTEGLRAEGMTARPAKPETPFPVSPGPFLGGEG